MNVATVPLGCVLPVRGIVGSVPPILPPIGLVVVAGVVPMLPVIVLATLLDEVAALVELVAWLADDVIAFCELVIALLDEIAALADEFDDGWKLVGIPTVCPPAVNVPVAGPEVESVGIV